MKAEFFGTDSENELLDFEELSCTEIDGKEKLSSLLLHNIIRYPREKRALSISSREL